MNNVQLFNGDCLEIMRTMEPHSCDSIVTDPPYGLSNGPTKYLGDGGSGGFMGKDWDHGVPGVAFWEAALRVAKPGAFLLAFGGTRTHHRLMVAIEDAGWEIRDVCMWLTGQGFPKGHDISKAIDKAAGAEREVVGMKLHARDGDVSHQPWATQDTNGNKVTYGTYNGFEKKMLETAPATDAAHQWRGWNTALKPAWEPIIMARKPLSEKNIAANVQAWGTGGINVDACRVGAEPRTYKGSGVSQQRYSDGRAGLTDGRGKDLEFSAQGRWPANLCLDPEASALLDEMSGVSKSTGGGGYRPAGADTRNGIYGKYGERNLPGNVGLGDSGGASRFFARFAHDEDDAPLRFAYVPKASKRDRDEGLEGMEERIGGGMSGTRDQTLLTGSGNIRDPLRRNHHPTVKPTALCRWLVRLVTPPGGTVLDPFMGSGSTGKAAVLEGFNFVGIELDPEYLTIAEKRIAHAQGKAAQPAHMPQLPLLEMTGD